MARLVRRRGEADNPNAMRRLLAVVVTAAVTGACASTGFTPHPFPSPTPAGATRTPSPSTPNSPPNSATPNSPTPAGNGAVGAPNGSAGGSPIAYSVTSTALSLRGAP